MNHRRFAIGLFLSIAFLSLSPVGRADTRNIQPEAVCRQRIAQGKFDEARAQCLEALRSRDLLAEIRWRYLVDFARCQRLQNDARGALETLKNIGRGDRDRAEVSVEAAYDLVTMGNVQEATRLLQAAERNDDPANQAMAGLLRAKLIYADRQYAQCIAACDGVVAAQERALASEKYKNLYDTSSLAADLEDIKAAATAARKLAAQARDDMVMAAYGADYAAYRQARLAQSRGEYDEAFALYQNINAPVLADAARCYMAACTAEQGTTDVAFRQYQQGLKASVSHLYDAESLVQMAQLGYLQARNVAQIKQCRQYLDQARAVLYQPTHVQTAKSAMASFTPVLKQFPAEKDFNGPTSLGTYYEMLASPEAIINELTTAWYVPRLKVEVELLDCLLATEAGDKAGAMQALQAIQKLGAAGTTTFLHSKNVLRRLAWDANEGAFLMPSESWANLPASVRLASFSFVAGKTDRARKLFGAVRLDQASSEVRSAARLGTAYCEFQDGHDEAVEEIVAGMVQHRANVLDLEGVLLLANMYSGRANKFDQAVEGYRIVVDKAPRTAIAARALLAMAVSATNHGDREKALAACKELTSKNYKAMKYYSTPATVLADKLARRAKQGDAIVPEADSDTAKGPRVVAAKKHFVLPGNSDGPDISNVPADCLVRYEVNYSTLSSCYQFKYYYYRLDAFEPQVESTKESSLIFLRCPALLREAPLEVTQR